MPDIYEGYSLQSAQEVRSSQQCQRSAATLSLTAVRPLYSSFDGCPCDYLDTFAPHIDTREQHLFTRRAAIICHRTWSNLAGIFFECFCAARNKSPVHMYEASGLLLGAALHGPRVKDTTRRWKKAPAWDLSTSESFWRKFCCGGVEVAHYLEMQASTLRREFFTSLVGTVPMADCE